VSPGTWGGNAKGKEPFIWIAEGKIQGRNQRLMECFTMPSAGGGKGKLTRITSSRWLTLWEERGEVPVIYLEARTEHRRDLVGTSSWCPAEEGPSGDRRGSRDIPADLTTSQGQRLKGGGGYQIHNLACTRRYNREKMS